MAMRTEIKGTSVSVGDTVKVQTLLIEGEKTRLFVFEGVVLSIKGREENKSFVVRRIGANRVGVERIWPINSPWIKKVEVVRKGNPRRAKLYYLRDRKGRESLKVRERVESKTKKTAAKRSTSGTKSKTTSKK